jgi:hypothetical protein
MGAVLSAGGLSSPCEFSEAEAASLVDDVATGSIALLSVGEGGAGATFFTRGPDGILDCGTRVWVDAVFSGPAFWFGLAVWLPASKDKGPGAANAFPDGVATLLALGGA